MVGAAYLEVPVFWFARLVLDTSPKYIDREGLGKRRKSINISFPYYDWRQWWKSIVGDHTNVGEIKQ